MAAFSSVASQSSLLWSLQACYLKIELWKRILAMRLQTKLNKFQSAGGLVEEQDWNQTIKSVLNFYVTWESAIRIPSEMEAGSSKANSAIFFVWWIGRKTHGAQVHFVLVSLCSITTLTYPTSSNSTSTTSKTNLADSSSTTSDLGILVIGGSPYSRSVELWAPASHKEGGKVVELIGDSACVCCNICGR